MTMPSSGMAIGVALVIQQAVQVGARRHAGDGEFALAVAVAQARRHAADRFGADHAGQVLEVVEAAAGAGFGEEDGHVLACCAVPLEGEQVVDAVAIAPGSTIRPVASARPAAVKTACHGRRSMLRSAMRKAGLKNRVRPMRSKQRRLEIGRRFRPHRLGGRQFHRLPHDRQHAEHGGAGADDERQAERAVVHPENQRREAEKHGVEIHQHRRPAAPADAADDRAERADDERELQVVQADLPRRIAERLQLGDLLALEPDEPRQHRIHHEGGDAEEHDRIGDRQRVQHAQFVVEALGGRLVLAGVGPAGAVGREQAVHFRDDRRGIGAGREIDADVVERAVEIVGHGDGAVVHPDHAEAFVVRQGLAGARLEDELRREADAADFQGLAAAVDHGDEGVAGLRGRWPRRRPRRPRPRAARRGAAAGRCGGRAVELLRAGLRAGK